MRRPDLEADCARCAAICCSATSFEASEDFACDKAAGTRCAHLEADNHCNIYAERIERGYSGCVAFECFGAGQRVTHAFAGAPDAERDTAFLALREVHELLFQLTEAQKLCPPRQTALRAALGAAIEALDALPLDQLRELDLTPHEARVRALLRCVGVALGDRRARWQLQVLR
jgi:hypothetical protein